MTDERPKFETPYQVARRIATEEWHSAVKEYHLRPGSVTEAVIGRIINRLDETPFQTDDVLVRLDRLESAVLELNPGLNWPRR